MLTETALYREIFEQPAAIGRILAREQPTVRALADAIKAQGIDHIVIAARGTSDNAGRYAKYVLGSRNGMQVALATPSLFSIYERPINFGNALVLGISQSGQSPDIVAVLAEAQRQGKLTAAITNTPDSPLGLSADFVINLQAGAELAVAATKTYTNSLAAIALLSTHLADDPTALESLDAIAPAMQATLALAPQIAQLAPRYRYMQHCVVIGRGYNYATAFEMALKLKELTYSIVEPYSSADFEHGPFAVIEAGFPVIVVAPKGKLSREMQAFVQKLGTRSAETLVISDDNDLLKHATIPVALPASLPEWLSPFTSIIVGQLLAIHLASIRGFNPDAPRAIHKITKTH